MIGTLNPEYRAVDRERFLRTALSLLTNLSPKTNQMAYDLTTSSEYLRSEEVMLIKIDMSEYLLEYYTHRKTYAPDTKYEHDVKLKDLIACFAIHLTARMPVEIHAWTLHIMSDEPYSLFVTGSSGEIEADGIARGFLVGNVLTDHVQHSDINGFHAQFTHRGKTSRSYSSSESSEVDKMTEAFYASSEQRPLRISLSSTSDTAIGLLSLPGCDPEWFESVDIEALAANPGDNKAPMRSCAFTFTCDCSPDKLLPFFRALPEETLNSLYGDDDELRITCPRCAKQFSVARSEVVTDTNEQ